MMAWDPKALSWDWDIPLPNGCLHGGRNAVIPGEALSSHTQPFQVAASVGSSFLSGNVAPADYAGNGSLSNQCNMLLKQKELEWKAPNYRYTGNLELSNQQEGSLFDTDDCNATQGRISQKQEGKFREARPLDCGFKACSLDGLYPNQCNMLPKNKELDCKASKCRNMVNIGSQQEEPPSDAGNCIAAQERGFLKQEGKLKEEHHLDHGSKAGSGVFGESSIYLQLGKRTYFEDTQKRCRSKAAPKSTPGNPVKKSRLAAAQMHFCQVEGCKLDLTSAKDYHRRHKVCEMHSKSAVVIVAGQEQRFCQQCSRFHVLLEFDEYKRSCRRRLAGHNDRRRKPQSDLLAWNRRYPAYQDDRYLKHFITERQPFLPHQGLSNTSSVWENPVESKFMLVNCVPKDLHFETQSVHGCHIQRQETENNYFPSTLYQETNDRSQLLQCQKFMLPISNSITRQIPLTCSQSASNPSSRNLVLLPSAGACSGCESPQSSTNVLYSGCALSLLPSEQLCQRASVSISLNSPVQSSTTPDEWLPKTPFAGQLVQGQQQQMVDLTKDKVIPITSQSHSVCIPSVSSGNGISIPEKEHYAQFFIQDLIHERNGESHALNDSQVSTSEDVKATRDIVHLSLLSQNSQMHGHFAPFQLGDSYTLELEGLRPFETPVFASHEIL